jgi:hypothetical protein
MAEQVATLDPTDEDKRQALTGLLNIGYNRAAVAMQAENAQLFTTSEDKRQACSELLSWAGQAGAEIILIVAPKLILLDPSPDHRRRAFEIILGTMASSEWITVWEAADKLSQFATTGEDKRRAREALLGLLAGQTDIGVAAGLARGLAELAITAEEKGQARETVFRLLADQRIHGYFIDDGLARVATKLDPTVHDLALKTFQPPGNLLAAIRRNSPLTDWLAALPALAPPPDPL